MERRVYDFGDLEVREDGGALIFRGHAAVFNTLSLPIFGFRERIDPKAFNKTVREADVRFLAQHDPATVMARTKAGTLKLSVDKVGLRTEARLNPSDPDVQRLAVKMRDGNIDQMSFGFEVVRDEFAEEEVHDEFDDGPTLVRTLKEVRLWDVSPVTFPAYPATDGQLAGIEVPAEVRSHVEELRKAIPAHSTDTSDASWDGPAAVAAMPNEASVLRYCHAWFEGGDADPDAKSSYKFPHHRTEGGPAILGGVRNGLSRLPNADIPDSDRAGVERHLRRHLDDASRAMGVPVEDLMHETPDLSVWRNRVEMLAKRLPPIRIA